MAFWRVIIIFLALLLSLALAHATNFYYCDEKNDYVVKVKDLEVSPNPAPLNKHATFKLTASTTKAITGGNIVIYKVLFDGDLIDGKTLKICHKGSCPISPGNFVLTNRTLPKLTGPVNQEVILSMVDKKFEELTCIGFTLIGEE